VFLCIYLLPIFLNGFLSSIIGGAEASAARMLIRAFILPFGVALFCIPLLIVTRRRLRDVNLSGVFLLAFPIWPMVILASGPFFSFFMFPLGGQQSLFLKSDFWLGALCVFLLSFLPGYSADKLPKHSFFLKLQLLTECKSRINAQQFRKGASFLLAGSVVLSIFPFLIGGIFGSRNIISSVVIIGIILEFLNLILTSFSIRRLNDLGNSYLWVGFISFFLPPLLKMTYLIVNPKTFLHYVSQYFSGFGIFHYIPMIGTIGFFLVFIWLMFGKTSEHVTIDKNTGDLSDAVPPKETFSKRGRITLAMAVTILSVIVLYKINHPYDYYRYRMTVTVETPDGLKTGSAVRQGNFEEGPERRASWAVGEAVVVDLGQRGLLFALIDSSNIGDGVSYITTCNHSDFGDKKTPVGKKWILSPGEYPALVAFKDLNNPKTMQSLIDIKGNGRCGGGGEWEVQADHFDGMFGVGVKLKEISLEITDDPITVEIEKRLPWLSCPADGNHAKRSFSQARILDTGTFKREPREFYLKKMKETSNEPEKPECAAFREQWDTYDRKKFQDDIQHWKQLVDQGNAEAEFETGTLIARGDGHEILANRKEAVKWYTMAANQGYQDAQAKLANVYEYREGVQQDWQEAYFWASLSAKGSGGHNLTNNSDPLTFAPTHMTAEQKAAVERRIQEWKPTLIKATEK
jgi:uncharacterized membrane protein YhaH (DUF805 family)